MTMKKKAVKRAAAKRAPVAPVAPVDGKAEPAPRRSRIRTSSSPVLSLIPDAFSIMSDLKDELENWKEGIPENLQGGDKYSTLDESCSTIDGVTEIDPSETAQKLLEGVEGSYMPAGKRPSRSDRRNEACAMIRAAADAIQDYIEKHAPNERPDVAAELKGTDCLSEDDRRVLEDLAEECTEAADEWENVEFPGMFG